MKAIEQYFHQRFLYKVILTFTSVDKSLEWTVQIKATEHFFYQVLLIMLYV